MFVETVTISLRNYQDLVRDMDLLIQDNSELRERIKDFSLRCDGFCVDAPQSPPGNKRVITTKLGAPRASWDK